MRRNAIAVLGVVLAVAAAGCGTSGDGGHPADKSARPTVKASSSPLRVAVRDTGWGGEMQGVVATAADDAWAVGSRDEGTPVVLRWQGRTWSEIDVPERTGAAWLTRVAASSPNEVWALGGAETDGSTRVAVALRWNGRGWTPAWRENDAYVQAVAVAGPGDVWVAFERVSDSGCRTTVRHRTAAGWTAVRLPSGACVQDLRALSPRDVWAVGTAGDRPAALHWDGRGWRSVPLPEAVAGAPEGRLSGLAAQSPTQVWAVGRTERDGDRATPVVLRWDGHAWARVDTSGLRGSPAGAAADGRGGVFVFGGASGGSGRIFHYDGRAWTGEHADGDVNDLAVFPGTSRIAVVGGRSEDLEEDNNGMVWMRP